MIRATTLAVTIAALSTFVTTIGCGGDEPAPAPAAAKPAPTKATNAKVVKEAKASKVEKAEKKAVVKDAKAAKAKAGEK